MGEAYIKWLTDLSKSDVKLAGGKGANLGEMYNAKFPVPPAFVITTDSFFYFLKETNLEEEIRDILNTIKVDDTEKLQQSSKEIKELIIKAEMPLRLEKEIIESYDHFNIDLSGMQDSPGALAILRSAREPVFVSVRSSATAEDLEGASFAGQQESFINIKGNSELILHVKKVFASIFTARSIFYRKKKGFDSLVGIAAVVQRMVNSEKSGVMFSRHPVTGKDDILIEAVFGQGEGIVSGRIKPDQHILTRAMELVSEHISDKKLAVIRTSGGQTKTVELTPDVSNKRVLKTHEQKSLAEFAIKLEEHYKLPQDIEFAIENNEIFILQTRPITTIKEQKEAQEIDGQMLSEGLAASPGVASGVVKIIVDMSDLRKIKDGDILVTKMTNPDMVVSMEKAAGIVTSEGGITAHAAIVSREMGIPAVVGAQNILDVVKDGDQITVDGFNGKVFTGLSENKSVEILPIVETKTKIKTLCDLPKFAKRAALTKASGVGLVRLEGIIAEGGKHPLYFEESDTMKDYEDMITKGLKEIAEQFIGKPIWVRSSDIRSDEYANLEGAPKGIEKNPMLGFHGIRFSLKHDKIFRAELRAIKAMADLGHKFGVMFPQIISVEEVQAAKKICQEEGCIGKVEFGVMIETPAAAILIGDICKEGIDFISFGTNDLTQFTLAIDRGNEEVQYIYDELNWAVLKQISRVIRECKKNGVQTSICGQAGSKPEMVKFLVEQGIDSISVNADMAKEISELVQKLENGEDGNDQKPKEETKPEESEQRPEQNPIVAPETQPEAPESMPVAQTHKAEEEVILEPQTPQNVKPESEPEQQRPKKTENEEEERQTQKDPIHKDIIENKYAYQKPQESQVISAREYDKGEETIPKPVEMHEPNLDSTAHPVKEHQTKEEIEDIEDYEDVDSDYFDKDDDLEMSIDGNKPGNDDYAVTGDDDDEPPRKNAEDIFN